MNPRILFLDTENAPNIAAVWGIHDQRVSYTDIVKEWFFISAQWQWLDSKENAATSPFWTTSKAFKKDFTGMISMWSRRCMAYSLTLKLSSAITSRATT
jgi:hypothetical protein